MGSILDIVTFDVFDFDGSRDKPDGINVNVPPKTAEENELVQLQLEALKKQLAPPTAEELALRDKMQSYYDTMMAEDVLSPEEEAEFDKEYQLQVEALKEQYGMMMEEQGGSRMAELASRGVLETTTGQDIIAKDQKQYASVLNQNISELLEAKEVAKSDVELAKKQMAQQGYNLTSGIFQTRQNDALAQAASLQNYYTNQRNLTANTMLQNALRNQSFEQWAYNRKIGSLGTVAGIGLGMAQSGFSGMG